MVTLPVSCAFRAEQTIGSRLDVFAHSSGHLSQNYLSQVHLNEVNSWMYILKLILAVCVTHSTCITMILAIKIVLAHFLLFKSSNGSVVRACGWCVEDDGFDSHWDSDFFSVPTLWVTYLIFHVCWIIDHFGDVFHQTNGSTTV